MLTRAEIISESLTERTSRKLLNDIFRDQGMRHALHTLPLHFQPGAFQRYGYKTRNSRYTKWKFRKYQHRKPNVKSGALEKVVIASARAGVKATYRGWTVRARGTSQHPMWSQSKDEIERIAASEEENYKRDVLRHYVNRAGKGEYKFRTRKVIRKS